MTTYNLAVYFGKTTDEMFRFLLKKKCLAKSNDGYELTEKGKAELGGEKRAGRNGTFYFLWNNPARRK